MEGGWGAIASTLYFVEAGCGVDGVKQAKTTSTEVPSEVLMYLQPPGRPRTFGDHSTSLFFALSTPTRFVRKPADAHWQRWAGNGPKLRRWQVADGQTRQSHQSQSDRSLCKSSCSVNHRCLLVYFFC